jgi:uncharacterized protein YyaL (SSP411 family)
MQEIMAEFIPHKIVMSAEKSSVDLPLLASKRESEIPLIYLCKQYSCLKPVSAVGELLRLLKEGTKIE